MSRWLRSLRHLLGLTSPEQVQVPNSAVRSFPRSIDTDFSIFREGDRAVIHGKHPSLTKPLEKGKKTDVRRGTLHHDHIIGRRVWDLVQAHKGPEYRLSLPTLDEYVALTPRHVTPIYATDANLIVSLLDIHVAPPHEDHHQPLEILESGTGHGSLTLHLARAIQAANSNPPPIPARLQTKYLQGRPTRSGAEGEEEQVKKETGTGANANANANANASANAEKDNDNAIDPIQQQWDTWRAQRKAIIHTVDISPKFSTHAEKIVRGFRRGIYTGNVDFYVGHIENWIAEQTKLRTKTKPAGLFSSPETTLDPFLSYAILDMPSAHLRIPHVSPILKRDGLLAVFMPSVTQIGDCVDIIRRLRLPFVVDRVVELGAGISGGRLWDVRFAVKKSRADPASWNESGQSESESGQVGSASASSGSEGDGDGVEGSTHAGSGNEGAAQKEDESVLVCRPKVGTRIVGGGFVGLWRKIEDKS